MLTVESRAHRELHSVRDLSASTHRVQLLHILIFVWSMSWAVRDDLSDTVLSKAICGSLAALCDTTRSWALPVFTHIVVHSLGMNGCTDVDIILHLLAHSEGLVWPLTQTSRGRFSRQVRALKFGVSGPFHHIGALAHRGLPPVRGFVREVPLAFPRTAPLCP